VDTHDPIRLIVLRGVEGRREFLLEGERIVVGSPEPGWEPGVSIVAPGVLRHHATLVRDGDRFRLEPAPGARVVVNRREFLGGSLDDGDQVAFGGALFQVWAGGLRGRAPQRAAAAPLGVAGAGGAELSAEPSRTTARTRAAIVAVIVIGGLLLLVLLRSLALGPRA
jgi:hypothetical protein